MTADETFLRAIFDRPDEDVPRLQYADWLDEQGDPRGEFIRVQIELARLDEDDERRPALQERERQLLEGHQDAWAGSIPDLVEDYAFRRGFVESVTVTALTFLEKAKALFDAAPLRRVQFIKTAGMVADLAESVFLRRLAELRFFNCRLRHRDAAALAGSGHLKQLVALDLGGDGEEANALGDVGARALAGSRHLSGLQTLLLRGNRLSAAGAQALAKAPLLARLTWLDLSGNAIGAAGVEAVASSPHQRQLRLLSFQGNRFGASGGQALSAAKSLAELTTLDLAGNDLGEAGLLPLLASWPFPRLRRLNLSGNNLGPASAAALAASPHLNHLVALNLEGNRLGAEGLRLLQARFGPALRMTESVPPEGHG